MIASERIMSPLTVLKRLAAGDSGLAAVEFALLSPLFLLVFAGMVDIGNILYSEYQLTMAVSSGAQYAMVNSGNVSSTNGASLATSIATIVSNTVSSGWANDTVVVNNGPTVSMTGGTASSSGTASNADLCYCPTGTMPSITWGTSATCGSSCAGGGIAGQFVTITATRAYTVLFAGYGIVSNGTITKSVIVEPSITAQ
jgi:Flp pilus assembly protein TadG